jgi:hypothetical protein
MNRKFSGFKKILFRNQLVSVGGYHLQNFLNVPDVVNVLL